MTSPTQNDALSHRIIRLIHSRIQHTKATFGDESCAGTYGAAASDPPTPKRETFSAAKWHPKSTNRA
jgi:hypothetical protein